MIELNDQSQFLNQNFPTNSKLSELIFKKLQLSVLISHIFMQISAQNLTSQQPQTLKDTTQAQNIPTVPQLKSQQSKAQQQKHYYFETQTKRLKEFYIQGNNLQSLVSRRILFNNSAGIVRYVGELKNQGAENKGQLWVGIEWQDIGRGKHNGTVKGFKYFQCPPFQGSMVKYQKIQFGYRLQTALFKRYFKSEEMQHARNIYEELKLFKKEINQKETSTQSQPQNSSQNTTQKTSQSKPSKQTGQKTEQKVQIKKIHKIEYDADAYFDSLKKTKKIMVEFVGFDQIWTKINNLDKIQSISLPQCRICDFGPRGHLNDIFKCLKVLSLQDNLLSHYNQIFQLGLELPHLQQLALTNNRLAEPQLAFQEMKQIALTGYESVIQLPYHNSIFPRLKTLVLINTGLSWKILFKIIKAFNKLSQLVLCRNDLTDYQNIDLQKLDCFDELTFLNLEETKLKSFKNLMVFKDLPKLQKLTLNKNPISQFGRQIHGFTSLKKLSVQSCQVKKAVVIYQLSNFKNVQNLNFKHNPLNDLIGNEYVRLRSIAEFQKLAIINGAPLKKYERKDSEIFYMRESFREYFHVKNRPDYDYDFNDFLKWCDEFHPNIQMFIKKYGNPYEVQQKKQIKEIIKNEVKQVEMKKGTGMAKVKIYFEELESTDERKIPMTWTLANLKNFLAKTTKIPSGMQIIWHRNETQKLDEEISQDHKQLSFYNITEESTLTIRRKNTKGGISFVV